MGGLIGTQFTKKRICKVGLSRCSRLQVLNPSSRKPQVKTILQGLEGIIGDERITAMWMKWTDYKLLNPITQALPAADIDIEREIQKLRYQVQLQRLLI